MRPLPDYGDHMALEDFVSYCRCGGFIDYDGTGYYATETEYSDIPANPSDMVHGNISKSFTHVIWFNK